MTNLFHFRFFPITDLDPIQQQQQQHPHRSDPAPFHAHSHINHAHFDVDTPTASHLYPASSSSPAFDHLYKPKIWSLADTATGGLPWGAKYSGGQLGSCHFGGRGYGGGVFGGVTDTPPQTPPNMKVAVHSSAPVSTQATSYIEAYMGQPGMCPGQEQLQGELAFQGLMICVNHGG